MEKVLLDAGGPLKASDLAEKINARGLYQMRDGSPVQPDQVRAWARRYPHLFTREAAATGIVQLRDWQQVQPAAPKALNDASVPPVAVRPIQSFAEPSELAAALLEQAAFSPAGAIDLVVPNRPGLYAIRVRDTGSLPQPFRSYSEKRRQDLLYIGLATTSLSRRFLGQELRARGHGTLFRSIGALLGYRPPAGSLHGKSNTGNYRFAPADNQAIIDWINANLLANWVETSDDLTAQETALIRGHRPLLNLQRNPAALPELSSLRAECVRIANLVAE